MSEATIGRGPTPEQRAAIETRDRDVFCEAGAGTGKTRVLVGRYCGALLEDGAEIDEILAFTFTERAAAELRQRIRRELAGRGERRLARDTEGAWVTTIHGFCRRLLAAHPVAAGLDPRFRVLDAPESQRLLSQAAREAVDALVTAGNDAVQASDRGLPAVSHTGHHSDGARAPAQPRHGRSAPARGRGAHALAKGRGRRARVERRGAALRAGGAGRARRCARRDEPALLPSSSGSARASTSPTSRSTQSSSFVPRPRSASSGTGASNT